MTVAALVLGAGSGERLRESLGAGVRESEREDEAPWGLPKAFVPLAGRCLKKSAYVLGTTGRPFTDENIGDALASREISAELRQMGLLSGGPAPFQPKDRSAFLQQLDAAVHALRRKYKHGVPPAG